MNLYIWKGKKKKKQGSRSLLFQPWSAPTHYIGIKYSPVLQISKSIMIIIIILNIYKDKNQRKILRILLKNGISTLLFNFGLL